MHRVVPTSGKYVINSLHGYFGEIVRPTAGLRDYREGALGHVGSLTVCEWK